MYLIKDYDCIRGNTDIIYSDDNFFETFNDIVKAIPPDKNYWIPLDRDHFPTRELFINEFEQRRGNGIHVIEITMNHKGYKSWR